MRRAGANRLVIVSIGVNYTRFSIATLDRCIGRGRGGVGGARDGATSVRPGSGHGGSIVRASGSGGIHFRGATTANAAVAPAPSASPDVLDLRFDSTHVPLQRRHFSAPSPPTLAPPLRRLCRVGAPRVVPHVNLAAIDEEADHSVAVAHGLGLSHELWGHAALPCVDDDEGVL